VVFRKSSKILSLNLTSINYLTLVYFGRAPITDPDDISTLPEGSPGHDKRLLVFQLIMAAHERPIIKTSIPPATLLEKLAIVLPKDTCFTIYHLSTPPTRTSAIYSAPPGARPDRTYCESHFLNVSIAAPGDKAVSEAREVLVYAVEVLIYSTAYDTTFFVSKADSTGYLHLLGLEKGTPSPIRDISATFLQHLIQGHERQNIQSVVSLFARAQDQYLFPGSVEYSGKHVLDDRGLVKWWCRVLDPLIEQSKSSTWESVQGYLVVPGLDTHETRSYIPRRSTPNASWTMGHPLLELSRHDEEVPPRCLIPHFPDDPKARFLDELDEETSRGRDDGDGQWKSVKSISQFWDMMAFRQECSAGRMVGFIWVVFKPPPQDHNSESVLGDAQTTLPTPDPHTSIPSISAAAPTPNQAQITPSTIKDGLDSSQKPKPKPSKKKKLSGPIKPRQPRIKTENKNYLLEKPESTAYYIWRPEGRGQIILDEADYKRVNELLLRLDFANLDLAASSSARWINEVRSGAWGTMRSAWGKPVIGTKTVEVQAPSSAAGVQTLNLGLVRKKRKPGSEEPKALVESSPQVNVLTTGMVRKKPKA